MTRPEPATCPSCGSDERGELGFMPSPRTGEPVDCDSDWHDEDAAGPGYQGSASEDAAGWRTGDQGYCPRHGPVTVVATGSHPGHGSETVYWATYSCGHDAADE